MIGGCRQYIIIQQLFRLSAATPPQSHHTNLQRGIRYYPAAQCHLAKELHIISIVFVGLMLTVASFTYSFSFNFSIWPYRFNEHFKN